MPPWLREALGASAGGDVETALRLLRQAAQDHPDDPRACFLLGAELAQAGSMAAAEAAFAAALVLAPGFAMARFQLGLLQFSSGRAALALVTWQPLLEGGERDALCHFVRGFGALAADRFDEALEQFERGIRLNVDNEPLNADIRAVIQRIRETRATTSDGGQTGTDEAQVQVLISNYRMH